MIKPDGIPEPSLSPYLLFAKEQVNQIKISHPDCSVIEMMKIVGGCWKNLSVEDKKMYYDLFQKNKEEYDQFKIQQVIDNQANLSSSKENSLYLYNGNEKED